MNTQITEMVTDDKCVYKQEYKSYVIEGEKLEYDNIVVRIFKDKKEEKHIYTTKDRLDSLVAEIKLQIDLLNYSGCRIALIQQKHKEKLFYITRIYKENKLMKDMPSETDKLLAIKKAKEYIDENL